MHVTRFSIAAPLMMLAAPAFAQVASDTADRAADAATDIIVTAQRRAERLQDVPFSMTVQSGEQLAKSGVTTVTELPLVTTGLTMQSQGSQLQPNLRGVFTSVASPGASNPIATYVDGIYLSSINGSLIDLPDVERIEVLKGPQGTLFGRNVTGGAIQVFTHKPGFTTQGSISATLGYYDGAGSSQAAHDILVRGYVSGPLVPDKAAASISFSFQDMPGYGKNQVYGAVSPAVDQALGNDRLASLRSYLVRGKLLLTPTDGLEILASAWYSRRSGTFSIRHPYNGITNGQLFTDTVGATGRPWEFAFDSPVPSGKLVTRGASLKIDADLGAGTLTSTSAFAYSKYTEQVDYDGTYSPDCLVAVACAGIYDTYRNRDFTQELIFTSRKFGPFSFIAGGNIFSSNSKLFALLNDFRLGAQPLAPQVVGDPLLDGTQIVKTQAYGLFAEGNYEITDGLVLIAGARYSDETSKSRTSFSGGPFSPGRGHWKSFTPRVSLRYALDRSTNVYATVSRGFKSGVFTTFDPTVPPARPEKLTAYEVGFKTAQSAYSLNLAAFYYDYKDMQVQAQLQGVTIAVSNAAAARIAGVEFDGTAKLFDALSLRAGISWIPHAKYKRFEGANVYIPQPDGTVVSDIDDVSGSRLLFTPKLTATAGLTYSTRMLGGDLDITPSLYYSSKYYYEFLHNLVQKNYTRINVEAAYVPDGSNIRASLWVKNLTNSADISAYGVSSFSFQTAEQPPRQWGITLTYNF